MAPLEIDWSLRDLDWLHFLTIPLVTGTVGWLINWTGLIMLFGPIRFHGIRVPGKRELAAMHSVRMPKVVRRSIHLTPFGQESSARPCWHPKVEPDERPPHEVPEDDVEDSPT